MLPISLQKQDRIENPALMSQFTQLRNSIDSTVEVKDLFQRPRYDTFKTFSSLDASLYQFLSWDFLWNDEFYEVAFIFGQVYIYYVLLKFVYSWSRD